MFHGLHLYEEAVRVPLIFHWPDHIATGRIIAEPVEFTDLAPTVLDLVGVEIGKGGFQGRSLAAALRGKGELDINRAVFLHRRHYKGKFRDKHWVKGELFGVRHGAWKYIEGKEQNVKELFNLEDDPLERINLVAKFPTIAQKLARKVEKWKTTHSSANPVVDSVSEEDLKKLRALGYVR
jgi:arylsulfatase A-like enzyme